MKYLVIVEMLFEYLFDKFKLIFFIKYRKEKNGKEFILHISKLEIRFQNLSNYFFEG